MAGTTKTIVVQPPPKRVIMDIPSARQLLTQVSTTSHYEWLLDAPPGHVLDELELDLELTPTTTSTLARLSGLIKSLKVFNITNNPAGEQVDDTDGASIGLKCIVSQALREYARPSASPLSTVIVRDPQAGTTATAYYSNWRWHAPYDGSKFRVSLDLNTVVSVLVSATAVSASLTLVARWVPAHNAEKYTILANSFPSVPKVSIVNAYKGALCTTVEWNGNVKGMTLGTALSPEQIIRNEVVTNDDLFGLAAAGTGGLDTNCIFDPATGANSFIVLGRFADASIMRAIMTANQTIIVIAFGKVNPTTMVTQ